MSTVICQWPLKPFKKKKIKFPYRTLSHLLLAFCPCPLLSSQHNQSNLQVHCQYWISNFPSPVSTATSLDQAVHKSNPDDIYKSLWTVSVLLLLTRVVCFWHSTQNGLLKINIVLVHSPQNFFGTFLVHRLTSKALWCLPCPVWPGPCPSIRLHFIPFPHPWLVLSRIIGLSSILKHAKPFSAVGHFLWLLWGGCLLIVLQVSA